MPSVVEVTLQRSTAGPWGLRLQGGVDFEKTLLISHVTEGTPSHASGLMVKQLNINVDDMKTKPILVRGYCSGDSRS